LNAVEYSRMRKMGKRFYLFFSSRRLNVLEYSRMRKRVKDSNFFKAED
jgi:hypothetical protein